MTQEELRSETERWLAVAGGTRRGVIPLPAGAEKSAKAFLTLNEVKFRRTHDLNELGMQCSELNAGLAPLPQEASALTDFAVLFRYADAPREPDQAEAENGLETAQRVYDAIYELVSGPERSKPSEIPNPAE